MRKMWTSKPTRYCQLVREATREKMCRFLICNVQTFDNVVFTVEAVAQFKIY